MIPRDQKYYLYDGYLIYISFGLFKFKILDDTFDIYTCYCGLKDEYTNAFLFFVHRLFEEKWVLVVDRRSTVWGWGVNFLDVLR